MLNHTFVKFLIVGMLNTLFGYAIFSFFIYLDIHYYFAVALATIAGILFNFKTLGTLVFKNSNNRLFFKFILWYIAGYFVNIIILKFLLFYNFDLYIAGAFALITTALLSYLFNKKFVFKESPHEIN